MLSVLFKYELRLQLCVHPTSNYNVAIRGPAYLIFVS